MEMQKDWVWKLLLLSSVALVTAEDWELSIFHVNDIHSQFEEINKYNGVCSQKDKDAGECYGGIARLYQAVQDRKKVEKNVLFLSGGGMYQGSIWYTKFKSAIVWPFMNMMNFTASALGNHEFDHGPEELLPLAENANFDLVCANCDFSNVTSFDGLIKPYTVKEVGGRKVGIIGYTTPDTRYISLPGNVTFSDELTAVKAAAKVLKDNGVDIIIALGHSRNGLDKEIASRITDVDLVIGGHTHNRLYTGKERPSNEKHEYGYPTIVHRLGTGKSVPVAVVEANAYTKYLGYIKMKFDDSGEMLGVDGNAMLLDSSYPENPGILEKLQPWQDQLKSVLSKVIGSTDVPLETSRNRESTLGDLVQDAIMDWHDENLDPEARGNPKFTVALHNSGGIRSSLEVGSITSADVLKILPYSHTVDSMVLDVFTVKVALELSASLLEPNGTGNAGGFLQVAGVEFAIDLSKEAGSRITNLMFREGKKLDVYHKVCDSAPVLVYLTSFMEKGGDGYTIFQEKGAHHVVGPPDSEVLEAYIRKKSPIDGTFRRRIKVLPAVSLSDKRTMGLVAGLVIAAAVVILAAVLCWVKCRKRKQARISSNANA